MSLATGKITPDGWVVLKYNAPTKGEYNKVFGSWQDGYIWRLSSGCESSYLVDCGDYYEWSQESGSLYFLYKEQENNLTCYTEKELNNILNLSGYMDVTVERVESINMQTNSII